MRKLLITCILLTSFTAGAQSLIQSPASLDMDSTEFALVYGTVKEYNLQHGNMYDSRPVLMTGSKVTYVKDVCQYLANNGYSKTFEAETGDNWVRYTVPNRPGIVEKGEPQHISIKAFVDADYRTTKVIITGRANDIIELFLGYWPARLELSQLKKGGTIYQNCASDRVTFSWSGANPVIEVTKNPNVEIFGAITK